MKQSMLKIFVLVISIQSFKSQAMEAENVVDICIPEQYVQSDEVSIMVTGAVLALTGALLFTSAVPDDTVDDDTCTIL